MEAEVPLRNWDDFSSSIFPVRRGGSCVCALVDVRLWGVPERVGHGWQLLHERLDAVVEPRVGHVLRATPSRQRLVEDRRRLRQGIAYLSIILGNISTDFCDWDGFKEKQ